MLVVLVEAGQVAKREGAVLNAELRRTCSHPLEGHGHTGMTRQVMTNTARPALAVSAPRLCRAAACPLSTHTAPTHPGSLAVLLALRHRGAPEGAFSCKPIKTNAEKSQCLQDGRAFAESQNKRQPHELVSVYFLTT